MKLTHFKGIKPAWPWRIKKLKGNFNYTQRFTFVDPVYDLKDKDEQKDINKLTGVKPKYFRPHYNSKMIGWRWNLETEEVEIFWYWHDEDEDFHFSDVILTLKKGDSLDVGMYRHWHMTENNVELAIQRVGSTEVHYDTYESSARLWLIESWFGGTLSPTRKIKLAVSIIKKLMFNVR